MTADEVLRAPDGRPLPSPDPTAADAAAAAFSDAIRVLSDLAEAAILFAAAHPVWFAMTIFAWGWFTNFGVPAFFRAWDELMNGAARAPGHIPSHDMRVALHWRGPVVAQVLALEHAEREKAIGARVEALRAGEPLPPEPTREETNAELARRIRTRLHDMDAEYAGQSMPEHARAEFDRLVRQVSSLRAGRAHEPRDPTMRSR